VGITVMLGNDERFSNQLFRALKLFLNVSAGMASV